jgi:Asp-tRNA(Asn)/Glu-tRNA(Gln) amidotransferase A subunit family amidase
VPFSVGTDTGGSLRIPAAYCGIVGFKGTLGLVETDGIVPLSATMDHVGVLARSVSDAAIAFDAIAPTAIGIVDPGTMKISETRGRPLRVGVEVGYLGPAAAQAAVARAWRRAADALEAAGSVLVELRLPDARRWRAAHKVILTGEAWDFHRERLATDAPYGPVFRAAITAAGRRSAPTRSRALATRLDAIEAMRLVLKQVDVILTPTCPTVAPPLDEGVRGTAYTRYTTLAAFCGLPALSLPAGFGAGGLPVGVQLLGPAHGDAAVLRAGRLLEGLLER